jgi:hypothetical protein
MTDFIYITELWQSGEYIEVGNIISNENWPPGRVAEFCAYFSRFLGSSQLEILYKFI